MKSSKNSLKIIKVTVRTNSKKPRLEFFGDEAKIWVSQKPVEGEANKAVIAAIAEHFNTLPSSVRIVHGDKSRQKIVEIG